MASAARGLARNRDQALAARRRGEELDAGAGGHHGFAAGIACVRARGIGQRKHKPSVADAVAVEHVGAHGRRDSSLPGRNVEQFDPERLRGDIALVQRINGAACRGVAHAQRP